jgi:hypothetical protein
VVAVGVLLALAAGLLLGRNDRPRLATSTPLGRSPLIDPGQLVSGGPPPDGIPPVDRPRFVAAHEVGWLAKAEPVAVVETSRETKAYPLQLLVWHEIVNDTVGEVPVAVTYCPLCNTAVSFRRPVLDTAATTFGTSGKLYKSNLVMYDRATRSLWPQALGQAVTGELVGRRLERVATQIVAFADFRAAFPGGRVLSRHTGFDRPYGQNPYPLYDRDGGEPFLFDGRPDQRLPAVARVLGVSEGHQHLAVPYSRLAGRARDGVAAVNLELAGEPVLVVWRSGATSALDRRQIAAPQRGGRGCLLPPGRRPHPGLPRRRGRAHRPTDRQHLGPVRPGDRRAADRHPADTGHRDGLVLVRLGSLPPRHHHLGRVSARRPQG